MVPVNYREGQMDHQNKTRTRRKRATLPLGNTEYSSWQKKMCTGWEQKVMRWQRHQMLQDLDSVILRLNSPDNWGNSIFRFVCNQPDILVGDLSHLLSKQFGCSRANISANDYNFYNGCFSVKGNHPIPNDDISAKLLQVWFLILLQCKQQTMDRPWHAVKL